MAIHKIKFFAGRGSRYLAEKIAAEYGIKLGDSDVVQFSDGEFQPCFHESIRRCALFIIQSTFPPSDNLMELLMMADAARRASAHQVIAVTPTSVGHVRIVRIVHVCLSPHVLLPICLSQQAFSA